MEELIEFNKSLSNIYVYEYVRMFVCSLSFCFDAFKFYFFIILGIVNGIDKE